MTIYGVHAPSVDGRPDAVKGLHHIEQDIAGNLGLAWTVAFWDWPLLELWGRDVAAGLFVKSLADIYNDFMAKRRPEPAERKRSHL